MSTRPRCYVAAPYEDGTMVRDRVHGRLVAVGFEPSSRWVDGAVSAEDFGRYTPEELRRFAAQNDRDVCSSHVVLVLARPGAGGEMFGEARLALEWGLAVVWVGRRTLSAWRRGVVRVDNLDQAIGVLARMRVAFEDGIRGEFLAELGGGVGA